MRSQNPRESATLLVGHDRVIDHTGEIKSQEVQALIGKAIELNLIPMGLNDTNRTLMINSDSKGL